MQQLRILKNGLIVDTVASSHIINDRSRFKNFDITFKPERHSMELADGKRTFGLAQGRGDAQVCLTDTKGRRCAVTLKNALYIPSFPQDLFSVKSATANGVQVLFNEGKDVLVMSDGTRFDIRYLRECITYEQIVVKIMCAMSAMTSKHGMKSWPIATMKTC